MTYKSKPKIEDADKMTMAELIEARRMERRRSPYWELWNTVIRQRRAENAPRIEIKEPKQIH